MHICCNMFPMALGAAVQLDLFEILAVAGDHGVVGLSLSDIISRLSNHRQWQWVGIGAPLHHPPLG